MADELANIGAQYYEVPPEEANNVEVMDKPSWTVLTRLGGIYEHILQHQNNAPEEIAKP